MGKKPRKGLIMIGAAAFAGYTFLARPWFLRWGASDEEVRQRLPGDDIVKHPRSMTTRAVTIQAPAAEVWPWLVQMGQNRGGLYSYDRLENLLGLDFQSADHIVPELQHLEIGEKVRLAPEHRLDLALEVRVIEAPHALVLSSPGDPEEAMAAGYPAMSWAFVLGSLDEKTTRLVIRCRSDYKLTMTSVLMNQIFLEPIQFIMERKMLLGIKQRVERVSHQNTAQATDNIPVYIV